MRLPHEQILAKRIDRRPFSLRKKGLLFRRVRRCLAPHRRSGCRAWRDAGRTLLFEMQSRPEASPVLLSALDDWRGATIAAKRGRLATRPPDPSKDTCLPALRTIPAGSAIPLSLEQKAPHGLLTAQPDFRSPTPRRPDFYPSEEASAGAQSMTTSLQRKAKCQSQRRDGPELPTQSPSPMTRPTARSGRM